MKERRERRDVIRTKMAIGQAYYELLFLKNREKITVKDVLERANFSQGTFYAHYRDIEDLNDQLENYILEECRKGIQKTPLVQVEPVVEMFETHRQELKGLAKNRNEGGIVRKLKELLCTAMMDSLSYWEHPALSAICRCITGSLVDACVSWVIDDEGISRSALIRTVTAYVSAGIQGVIDGYDATMDRITFGQEHNQPLQCPVPKKRYEA